MRLLPALSCLLLAAPAAAQTQFTYAELERLDTPALSRLLLGASGERMIEHRIVIGDGSFGAPQGTMGSISFAAAPKFRTDATCVSDSMRITFIPAAPLRQMDPPVRIWDSEARKLWAILPLGTKDCSAIRPILDSHAAPGPYFRASDGEGQDIDPNTFSKAVAMLRGFLADPQRAGPIRCLIGFDGPDPRQGLCEARRFEEIFDVQRIDMLRVGDCRFTRPAAHDSGTCVSFVFPDPSNSQGSGTYLQLAFVTDLPAGTRLTDAARIMRIRIDKVTWVA